MFGCHARQAGKGHTILLREHQDPWAATLLAGLPQALVPILALAVALVLALALALALGDEILLDTLPERHRCSRSKSARFALESIRQPYSGPRNDTTFSSVCHDKLGKRPSSPDMFGRPSSVIRLQISESSLPACAAI
jgi:hypothetical protein